MEGVGSVTSAFSCCCTAVRRALYVAFQSFETAANLASASKGRCSHTATCAASGRYAPFSPGGCSEEPPAQGNATVECLLDWTCHARQDGEASVTALRTSCTVSVILLSRLKTSTALAVVSGDHKMGNQ